MSELTTTFKRTMLMMLIIVQAFTGPAQKKLVPASQSALTGIALPAGSKKDSRFLSVTGARMLLEMESQKKQVKISTMEVFSLPALPTGTFDTDSLINQLSGLGWMVTQVPEDKKYTWLQKENRSILAYFLVDKKTTELYFAELNVIPALNDVVNVPNNNNGRNAQTDTALSPIVQNPPIEIPALTTAPMPNTGFGFSTTNFDDGWNATVQEDWVEVSKGNIKVLLHYPKEGTIFPADPDVLTNAAWNILVAPRYSNLKNYKTAYISTFNRPYLGMGHATENASGKEVFVLLFRQGAGWLEFVSPDKNSFIQYYKFDPETIQWNSETDLLKPLDNMTNYNKFAVAASDFTGKWTSDFTGIQQLYNVYTGNYAGMHMNQSNEEFIFGNGNSYSWKLLVINGMAGSTKFNQVKSAGTFTMRNNWLIHFSNIENSAKNYHAHWSCIKGARILNLLNADYPGSGIYTKYGLAK